jgi:hypothetical protein
MRTPDEILLDKSEQTHVRHELSAAAHEAIVFLAEEASADAVFTQTGAPSAARRRVGAMRAAVNAYDWSHRYVCTRCHQPFPTASAARERPAPSE